MAFESLVGNPTEELGRLMAVAGISDYDEETLVGLIGPSRSGAWERYADAAWFERQEAACEETLSAFWARSRGSIAATTPILIARSDRRARR